MADDVEVVRKEIAEQGDKVRNLKKGKADKAIVDQEVAKLLELKAQLKEMTENGDDSVKFKLKPPKGMRDYGPEQMEIRESVLNKVTTVFKRHGAQAIDTPVCELKEILTGKYGEDAKLIYDLEDQGGEKLSLRYDLTVPFARFVAQDKISYIKRYQIGKVYRRDQPSMTTGRYREFYQCDFDIAGKSEEMIADVECLKITTEILTTVGLTDYIVKVNHRALIEGMFSICGVPESQFKPICSSIDKLDKMSWEYVRKEMTEEKGLPGEVADKIGEFVKLNGSTELIDQLLNAEHELSKNPKSKDGLTDLKKLFENAELLNIKNRLVGNFVNDPSYQVPCVGVSIGIERIFAILEQRQKLSPKNLYPTKVYIVTCGKNLVSEKIKIISKLWDAGINAEFSYRKNPRPLDQFHFCEDKGISLALVIGESEVKEGIAKVRVVKSREEIPVKLDELIPRLREMIGQLPSNDDQP